MCDYHPITWNHVLINLQTTEAMNVGSLCVNNFKTVIDKLNSKDKFLLFEKYHRSVNYNDKKHSSTEKIINYNETLAILDKFLSNNKDLKYKTLEPILKFTSKLTSDYGKNLFQKALDIFVDKKYYLIETSGLNEAEYNDPKNGKNIAFRIHYKIGRRLFKGSGE